MPAITRSLSARLLFAAALVLIVFLWVTGFVLDKAFQRSAENALAERLQTQIYGLLAAAEEEDGQLVMPTSLPDPLLSQLNSGLYAVIHGNQGQQLWHSPSAAGLTVPPTDRPPAGQTLFTSADIGADMKAFIFTYSIIWESNAGTETAYYFSVIQDQAPYLAEIHGFRLTLRAWLGGIGLALLVTQVAVMIWGLSPLKRLARDLSAIEQGKSDRLHGRYPLELQGITTNLNLLIDHERRQREKYRNTLADLAHSLKTPLAVLRGLIQQPTSKETSTAETQQAFDEQISRMDDIVRYQLQRATTPTSALRLKPISVTPLIEKILRSLDKVYADQAINHSESIAANACFFGEEGDIMEVLGNILDNAYKACDKQIKVSTPHSDKPGLNITVEDDGSGIAPKQRQAILQRGVRADTSRPGEGIGLAVATDIIRSYGGTLNISDSALGGALFHIHLPKP